MDWISAMYINRAPCLTTAERRPQRRWIHPNPRKMLKKEEAEDFSSPLTEEDTLIYSYEDKMSNPSNSFTWELPSSWKHFKKLA